MHTGKKVIYWADDDFEDLDLFQEVLAELAPELELRQFANGKLLLDQLHTEGPGHYPALIVLDINMPVLDGRETLALLKKEEKFATIPIVVFTTSNSELDKHFFEWMHTEMLTKPFTYNALKNTLQKILGYVKND
ncbi:response regulator [Paracnuella aquatica]|uniref:response regulator n=1 Tax=Paracnuella aquatica TaxID=2268757 RepID=UPI000DEF7136|nr:response regulator [Paracnuella aquatica]RPD48778.1 response regulator [Paracnuella aquatica]